MKNINNKNKNISRLKIAAFCIAVGITGVSIQSHNQNNKIKNNTSIQNESENNKEYISIFQEEILVNNKWEKGRIIFTDSLNSPVEATTENRVMFLGVYESSIDNLNIEIDSENILIDGKIFTTCEEENNTYIYQEKNLVNNKWQNGNIIITDGLIPRNTFNQQYTLIDTNSDIVKETIKKKIINK